MYLFLQNTLTAALSGLLFLTTIAAQAQQDLAANTLAPVMSAAIGGEPKPATVVLHGRVLSPSGVLPGAVVKLAGSDQRVVSNADGEFNLLMPAEAEPQSATISYAGFIDETVLLSSTELMPTVQLSKPRVIKVKRSQRLKTYMKTARRQIKKSARHK
jgi:hypothetical protein